MNKITKAVITAAGQGTRFLPATKNIPKELIPVINKPTIHYKVEACIKAGIKDIVIVTRYGNHSIEDYFDASPILEKYLLDKGKTEQAEMIKSIYTSANFTFVRQDSTLPYGNGAALYSVRNLIHEPFIFAYGDDFMLTKSNYIQELIDCYEENNAEIVLSTMRMKKEEIQKFSMVKTDNENRVLSFVEKPKSEEIDSDLVSIGNYILPSDIFQHMDPKVLDSRNEFLFQQSFDYYLPRKKVYSKELKGKFLTNGDPYNYVVSTIEVALEREDLKEDVKMYLKERLKNI